MSEYRRARDGRLYFFSVVTYMRQPILCQQKSITALNQMILEVQHKRPFEVKAWVILPDHLHMIWELPDGDSDYSVRWALIKKGFTKKLKKSLNTPEPNGSRINRREAAVWQRRFWEHQIRDESDYGNHMDYIHYNPVKHGLVGVPLDWKYTSFSRLGFGKSHYCRRYRGGVIFEMVRTAHPTRLRIFLRPAP